VIEGIPLSALGYGSGWALVAVFVIMLFRGAIVTRREHDGTTQDLRAQVEALRETNKHLAEQNSVMLQSAMPTVNSVLTALHQAAEGGPT
jgi:hypothetical protein